MTALPDRTQLQASVEALRRDRGAALLAGKPFDDRALEAAESKLEALDDAEAEQGRRQIALARAAEDERRAGVRETIAALDAKRLEALKEAEIATKRLAAALEEHATLAKQIRFSAMSLGLPPLAVLEPREIDVRLSRLFAAVIMPGDWRWGVLERNSLPDGLDGDWAERERKATADAIAELH